MKKGKAEAFPHIGEEKSPFPETPGKGLLVHFSF
jgi:hypothetical protein